MKEGLACIMILAEITLWVYRIKSYEHTILSPTKDLLTSRAGLLCVGQLLQKIDFSQVVDKYFPAPRSNRG